MSRSCIGTIALAVFLAVPHGTCALKIAGMTQRAAGGVNNVPGVPGQNAEVATPSLIDAKHHVDLVQEAEMTVGAYEMRKSAATKALVQRLRHGPAADYVAGRPAQGAEPTVAEIFWGGVFYVFSASVCAVVYRMLIHKEQSELEFGLLEDQKKSDGFEYGLFSFEKCDMQLAFCSFCCLCIRWPVTVSNDKHKMITFWPAFFIFTVLEGFTGILFGLLWIIWMGTMIYFRQKIRALYSLPHGTAGTYIKDCLSWAFCCCFAAAQEAKQMDVQAH